MAGILLVRVRLNPFKNNAPLEGGWMLNSGINVLLLEDDPDYAALLADLVSEHPDFKKIKSWTHRSTLKKAMEYLEMGHVDVILADLGLPETHGLEAFDVLNARHPEIAIVILTGTDDEALIHQAIQKGAQDYLLKTKVNAHTLMSAVAYALERKKVEKQSRIIFESSPSGMLLVDGRGKILDVNHQIETLFGYERHELTGQSISILMPTRFREQHPRLVEAFFHDPQKRPMGSNRELYALRKDGHEFPVEIGLNPTETDNGPCVIASIVDISERKKLDQMKNEFISMASHELRTPMTVIQVGISNLKDHILGGLNPEQMEVAQVIDANASRLSKIVTNLLDISRLESGQIDPKLAPIDVVKLVNDVVVSLEKLSEAKKISLSKDIHADTPFPLMIDEELIVQVLNNLTSNALRYAASKIMIQVGPTEEGVLFSVGNDGPSLSDEDLPKLFQKFSQIRRPQGGTGYKGTGLGLAICKEIIKKHNGRIWAQSTEDGLTSFLFVIPVVAPSS